MKKHYRTNIPILQKKIIDTITQVGGKVIWAKEHGFLAKLSYFIYKNEPKLNIEALFLGEKFGIVIHPNKIKNIYQSRIHRIINVTSLADFKFQFDQYKISKLSDP